MGLGQPVTNSAHWTGYKDKDIALSPNPSVLVAWSWPNLCDPMDYSPSGSSVHGILQARILEWVAMPSSRGSSQPRNQTWVSGTAGRLFTIWATREAPCTSTFPTLCYRCYLAVIGIFFSSVQYRIPPGLRHHSLAVTFYLLSPLGTGLDLVTSCFCCHPIYSWDLDLGTFPFPHSLRLPIKATSQNDHDSVSTPGTWVWIWGKCLNLPKPQFFHL